MDYAIRDLFQGTAQLFVFVATNGGIQKLQRTCVIEEANNLVEASEIKLKLFRWKLI
jgi:hypothetical protein